MLKHIDGFDQFQGQSAQALLTSLQSAGYAVTNGLAVAAGRKPDSFALELQVSPGAAGATWSSRTNTARSSLRAVAANAQGRFVAVGDGGVALTSVDSISWAALVLGTERNMRSIECVGGTFIAVGENGTILRSRDGQVWSARTSPIATMNIADVACNRNGRWLAVGANGNAGAIIVSDDDGLTWNTVVENPGAAANLCVEYGDCWMVGGALGQILTSDTGLSFLNRTFGAATDVMDLAFYNGTWLAVTARSVRRSIDKGVSWTLAASELMGSGVLNAIKVSQGRWIVVGDFAAIFMSDDTTVWTKPALTGTSNAFYDVNVSEGTQVGWCVVGARSGQSSSTATIYVSMAPPTTISRTFTSTNARVVIGFAHRATARGRILSIANLLNVDWPAGIEILGVRGASVPIRNVWYYYEIEIDKTAGKINFYVNDTLDMTIDLPAGGAALTTYALSWQAENGAVALFDDLYLLDGDASGGSTLTARLKPISVPLRKPTADVDVNWTGSAPGPHWPLVGLLPPSLGSYVRSAESGAQDLYSSSTPLPAGAGSAEAPILAVGVIALAQKSDLDNRQLGLVVGAVGNQKEVIDTTLSTSLEYSYAVFEKAPGDVAWTAENVSSTPFGIAVRP